MAVTLESLRSPAPQHPMSEADAVRLRHVQTFVDRHIPAGRPVYDSVVIAGGKGITAWTLAARLARSPELAGKVVVAGPPVEESRLLRNGVSLRGAAADFICYALQCSQAELVAHIAGPQAAGQPVATRQTGAMARQGAGGRWTFTRPGTWQGGRHGLGRPVMYGARNSRVAGSVRELLDERGIIDVEEPVPSLADARDLAPGRRPLVVNLTTNPKLLGAPAPPVTRVTLAAQMPLRVRPGGIRKPLTGATCFAPLVHRDGAIDVGYFTPFADPLSPDATWYGIMVRPLRADAVGDKAAGIDILADEVAGIGEALGLEPVDREVTQYGGMIPAPPFGRRPRSAPGTLELRRHCTPGAVAYYADGMIGGAVGGVMAAEAILRGADPDDAVTKALRRYVWWNDIWWFETTKIPGVVDRMLSLGPLGLKAGMAYPHSWAVNYWASRA